MLRSKTAKLNVVVHLNDGTRRKGTADGFDPRRSTFVVKEIDVGGNVVAIHDLDMYNVHAVFFVRDLAIMRTSRSPAREGEARIHEPRPGARLARVTFVWGEVLDGFTYDYDPRGRGFYIYPSGPLNRAHNIVRVFVSNKAAARVEVLATY